jgi:hypothetical protein
LTGPSGAVRALLVRAAGQAGAEAMKAKEWTDEERDEKK